MKYSAKDYARAFMELDAKEQHSKRLFEVMDKNGDGSQKSKVIKEIEKLIVKKNKGHFYHVSFARAAGAKERESILSQFSTKDRFITDVAPELVAGVRIVRNEEEELDLSFTGKLNKLFSN